LRARPLREAQPRELRPLLDEEAALWHSESALGPWAWVEGFHTEQRTYEHGLNVIDGSLIWRWSNADGSQRPNSRVV